MSQTEQEISAIEQQLLVDRIIFGASWKVVHADGTIERVPPDQMRSPEHRMPFVRCTWEQVKPSSRSD